MSARANVLPGDKTAGNHPLKRRTFRTRRRPPRSRSSGQTLVEFALVFPLFLLLLFAVIEFAFVFSAMLGISYATRDAALIAAEAGNQTGADCVILQTVEKAVTAPADDNRIQSVVIYRADQNGVEMSRRLEHLDPRRVVHRADGSCTVPYTRTTTGYPEGLPPTTAAWWSCNFRTAAAGTRDLDIDRRAGQSTATSG